MATGWTWDHIRETVTMSRLKALRAHWRQYPPIHKIAAAWVGYKPPEDTPPKQYMTADDMRRLMAMTGGRVAGVNPL